MNRVKVAFEYYLSEAKGNSIPMLDESSVKIYRLLKRKMKEVRIDFANSCGFFGLPISQNIKKIHSQCSLPP